MIEIIKNELAVDGNGKTIPNREFQGTNAERLAYPTASLTEGSSWFETDTFKLYFWSAASSQWTTKA